MGLSQWLRDWMLSDIDKKVTEISTMVSDVSQRVKKIHEGVKTMSAGLDLLEAKLQEIKTVDDSILALITDLNGKVQNATTLEEVQQFVQEMDDEKNRLLAAVNVTQ